MNISEGIIKRWSPRAFDKKPIDLHLLKEIFIAASSAPSASNEQPWRYVVGIKGDETYEKIFNSLNEFNQQWAKTAPVLAIGLVSNVYVGNKEVNYFAKHDLGSATAYLTMQALEFNVYVHQMGGFSSEKIIQSFNVPSSCEPITAIAMGYLGDISSIPPHYHARETERSSRNELKEIVFYENWENPRF